MKQVFWMENTCLQKPKSHSYISKIHYKVFSRFSRHLKKIVANLLYLHICICICIQFQIRSRTCPSVCADAFAFASACAFAFSCTCSTQFHMCTCPVYWDSCVHNFCAAELLFLFHIFGYTQLSTIFSLGKILSHSFSLGKTFICIYTLSASFFPLEKFSLKEKQDFSLKEN